MSNTETGSIGMRGFETLTPADGDLYWFCRKKRPALPETRTQMLELLLEYRDRMNPDDLENADGSPLTPEQRLAMRKGVHEVRREVRGICLEMEQKLEAHFWQFLAEIGCLPKGGRQ